MKKTAVAALLLSTGLMACSAATPGSTTTPSTSGLPSAVLATLQRCDVLTSSSGSSLSGKAATSYMTLNSNGSYTYSITYTDGTSCTGQAGAGTAGAGQTSTGTTDVFDYSQSGTYSVGANSDGTFTLTMQVTSQTFTTRTNTYGTPMRNDVNTICTLSLGAAATTTLPSSVNCNVTGSGAYIVPSPPFSGATITQLLTIAGRGYKLGAFPTFYTPGPLGTTAPSSSTYGFYSYY